ncbi:MAG: transposase [Inquilinus sp.]|uniref:transposase n=1 Tax=Inquilinus sp. TaxID=1932117 RepID=UPI003F308A09
MARVEILTGRERRRAWSDDQKLTILEEVATSRLGVAAIARRHDLVPQQVYRWRRQFLALDEVGDRGGALVLIHTLVAAASFCTNSVESGRFGDCPVSGRAKRQTFITRSRGWITPSAGELLSC